MKHLYSLLLDNPLTAKMKRGIKSFFHGGPSRKKHPSGASAAGPGLEEEEEEELDGSPLTLEEMIHRLDLEEAAAATRVMRPSSHMRLSCVNSSDILRSVKHAALNQYPRFSLDGRDSMYRSSFHGNAVQCTFDSSIRKIGGMGMERERVVWCKPGLVPKLMGLEAMPVPMRQRRRRRGQRMVPEESLRRMARRELERERLVMGGMIPPSMATSCAPAPIDASDLFDV